MSKDDPKPRDKEGKVKEFIEKVMKELDRDIKADEHNRREAVEDLKFAWGIEQWDPAEVARRKNKQRPVLQANLLPQFIDQVTGDQRHNRARISVKPVDSKADFNIARIRQGMISDIEYRSNAESIYDYASEMQSTCGYGAWRVLTRYTDENPFLQEIYLESIDNPFLVFMDCHSKDLVYADAGHGFILEKMIRSDFEEKYPDAEMPGKEMRIPVGIEKEHWYDKDNITVAEYFKIVKEEKEICLMDDGTVLEAEEAMKMIEDWETHRQKLQETADLMQQRALASAQGASPQSGSPAVPSSAGAPPPQTSPVQGPPPQAPPQGIPPQAPPQGAPSQGIPQKANMLKELFEMPPRPQISDTKTVEMPKVKHWIMTASEILEGDLEGEAFPGKYVPIILVSGKRVNIEGKVYNRGLIRFAKDPMRLFNYALTSSAEAVHLAPKAPWMVTPKQVQGFEKDYAMANTDNLPYMKYNMDVQNGVPAPPPQRLSLGDAPVALFAEIERAEGLVRKSIGMGQRDVGQTGPERSGTAIFAAQKPGDVSTYAFIDNLAKSITYCGQVINEMIPEIYDTKRDARLRDVDGIERWVPINTTADEALKAILTDPERYQGLDKRELGKLIKTYGRKAKYNDINEGHYGVIITVGPSYTTQRQESAQNLLQLSQNWPEIKKFAGDLLVKNMDFLGADEIAQRLAKTLPPGLKKLAPGEEPPPPPPTPPQLRLVLEKAQTEKIKQQKETLKQQVELIRLKTELVKQYKETKETEVEIRKQILSVLQEITSPQVMGGQSQQPSG